MPENFTPKELGDRIKRSRKAIKKTQQEVAKELDIAQSTYANYESGRYEVNASQLPLLAQVLETKAAYLLRELPDSLDPSEEELIRLFRKIAPVLQLFIGPILQAIIDTTDGKVGEVIWKVRTSDDANPSPPENESEL